MFANGYRSWGRRTFYILCVQSSLDESELVEKPVANRSVGLIQNICYKIQVENPQGLQDPIRANWGISKDIPVELIDGIVMGNVASEPSSTYW